MLKYQNVHRNKLIYIYMTMYKYSYHMQYWDTIDDKVYSVLSFSLQYCTNHTLKCRYGIYTLLLFQSQNVYNALIDTWWLNKNCTGFVQFWHIWILVHDAHKADKPVHLLKAKVRS